MSLPQDHALILRLPEEILLCVFDLVSPTRYFCSAFDRRKGHVPEETAPISPQCIAFSQVCQRWRRVALSSPSLWTVPIFQHHSLAVDMVKRAGSAPLTVMWPDIQAPFQEDSSGDEDSLYHANAPKGLASAVYYALSHGLDHIRELDLCGELTAICKLLDVHGTDCAPRLERLRIALDPVPNFVPNMTHCLPLPSERFISLPALTHLELQLCLFDLDHRVYANLTHLVIHSCPSQYGEHPSIDLADMPMLCEHAPLLEWLCFVNALACKDEHRRGVGTLAHLGYLEVEDTIWIAGALLSNLLIPTEAKLRIIDNGRWTDAIEPADEVLFGALGHCAKDVQSDPYRTVSVTVPEAGHVRLKGYTQDTSQSKVDLYMLLPRFEKFFHDVFGTLSFEQLADLTVQLDYEAELNPWEGYVPSTPDLVAALRGMPELKTLRLTYDTGTRSFCKELSNPEHVPPLCPSLSSLWVQAVSITGFAGLTPPIEDGFDNYEEEHCALGVIGTLLRSRRDIGIPLCQLVLKNAEIGGLSVRAWKARFRSWVEQVDIHDSWTATGRGDDDEDYESWYDESLDPSSHISTFDVEPEIEGQDIWRALSPDQWLGCVHFDVDLEWMHKPPVLFR